LQTPQCAYRTYESFRASTLLDLWEALAYEIPSACDYQDPVAAEEALVFEGFAWSSLTGRHWEVPLTATVVYLVAIVLLKRTMRHRPPLRLPTVVMIWNFSLSAFSLCGVYYCVPKLLFGSSGLVTEGLYTSVCSHASVYGHGKPGFFVMLFIYSKLAELVDTFWLLLRKAPVIFLHWYHHVTVLLYCWHAYSFRIGTGLYFAAMNYAVHAVMYFYFGLTQCGPRGRAIARRFAMGITLLQLAQMVVGIGITLVSLRYLAKGEICYVFIYNSILGLLMYASYFVLFLQLFLQHYVFARKPASDGSAPPDASSRRRTTPGDTIDKYL